MSSPSQDKNAVTLLAILNELNIRAFSCKKREALIFLILNETAQLVKYERAMLWNVQTDKPSLLGVSGQADYDPNSKTVQTLQELIVDIQNPDQIQTLNEESFSTKKSLYQSMQTERAHSLLWVPIIFEGQFLLGLLLERPANTPWSAEECQLLAHLNRGYAAAWHRFSSRLTVTPKAKVTLTTVLLSLLLLSFFIPVPLRVVAPCEVVAKNPILVTAPLNGIVEEMLVNPGDRVAEGDILFVYDKRVPLQELKVAQKQVDIAQSQLNRVMTQGVRDPKALNETAIWQLQLEKEKVKLELAEYQASRLEVKAPAVGVTAFDNPDDWRGRPVQIGERVLLLNDPSYTKIKIWLPESDNIPLISDKPIKIFLNIDPASSYAAKLIYIAQYTSISEKGVPSFDAEADWVEQPDDVKIGLKGTAILYGENVPLFYWLLRKPWNTLRRFIGW